MFLGSGMCGGRCEDDEDEEELRLTFMGRVNTEANEEDELGLTVTSMGVDGEDEREEL